MSIPSTVPASDSHPDFEIHHPPSRPNITKPSIIIYGIIPRAEDTKWQDLLEMTLSDLPIAILDPRRADWDSTWVEDISFPKFKEQVEWEMDYAPISDVIVFYFGGQTEAPISLLELGMYAGSGKCVVLCENSFKKKGNVQMVCARYEIPLFNKFEELDVEIRRRLEDKVGEASREYWRIRHKK